MNSVRHRCCVYQIVIGVVMTLSGSAIAQTSDTPDALSGPAVREGGVPGDSKSFTGGRRRDGDRPLAHRMFLQSLDVIRGEKAAAATRLTAEQEKSLRDLEKAFQADQRAYFEKSRAAIQKAREALGLKAEVEEGHGFRRGVEEVRRALQKKETAKKSEPVTEPAEEAMMSEDAMNEAHERARGQLQRIYANAPKPGDVHSRQWAVLTVAQQESVIKEIDRLQESEGEDRKNYLGRRDMLKLDMEDIVAGNKEVDVNDPRLPEAMREKLAAMTPEQRREAVRKFMEERGRKAAAGTEKKAAPKMDDVVLPAPEEPGTDEMDER